MTTYFLCCFGFGARTRCGGGVAGAVLPRDPRSPDSLNWGSGVEGYLGHTGRPGGQHSCWQTGSNLPGSRRSPKAQPAVLRTPLRPANTPARSTRPFPSSPSAGRPVICTWLPGRRRRSPLQTHPEAWTPAAQSPCLPRTLSWERPFFL